MRPKYLPYRRPYRRGMPILPGKVWDRVAYGLVGALLLGGAIIATLYLEEGEPAHRLDADLIGPVERIVDGDTLLLAGQRIRLAGMDAPETDQTCTDAAGHPWACGETATQRLRTLTRGRPLHCAPRGYDQYGRLLAQCSVAGEDLGRALVAEGLAVSYYAYGGEERAARDVGRGVWQGPFLQPAEWRRRAGDDAAATAEPGAGNPSRLERFLTWLMALLPN
jgi:endonuclease YncB( thermonuclease family)